MHRGRDLIRFNALRNALYHTARRRVMERTNRTFNFIIVVLGTASVGDVLGRWDIGAHWIGMVVAVVGALQLVWDFGRQARDHQALQRDYFALLADIEGCLDPSDDQCAEWESRLIRITADEPPVLRAIDSKAYNDALDSSDLFDSGERLHIPWWHRVLGGVLSFEGSSYEKADERRERLALKKSWWK